MESLQVSKSMTTWTLMLEYCDYFQESHPRRLVTLRALVCVGPVSVRNVPELDTGLRVLSDQLLHTSGLFVWYSA